jgi:hypothetical protein
MADLRRFDLDDVLHRPGTYVNPQTEVVLVVDDTSHVDAELLGSGDEWVLVSDEVPIDTDRRDELVEALEGRARRAGGAPAVLDHDEDDEADDAEVDELDEAGFSTGRLDEEDDDL